MAGSVWRSFRTHIVLFIGAVCRRHPPVQADTSDPRGIFVPLHGEGGPILITVKGDEDPLHRAGGNQFGSPGDCKGPPKRHCGFLENRGQHGGLRNRIHIFSVHNTFTPERRHTSLFRFPTHTFHHQFKKVRDSNQNLTNPPKRIFPPTNRIDLPE